MATQVNASDARDRASEYGSVIGIGEPRDDGGWNFLVLGFADASGFSRELVVSVVADEDGSLSAMAS